MNKFNLDKLKQLKKTLNEAHLPESKQAHFKYKPPKSSQNEFKLPSAKKTRYFKQISHNLKKDTNVGSLLAQARQVDFKNRKIKKYVGMPLAAHIDVVHVENKSTAFILADSSVWLQRARFMQEDIFKLLNRLSVKPVKQLRFKVTRF